MAGGDAALEPTAAGNGIEDAGPVPLVDVDRDARPDADSADLDVAIEYAPALLAVIRIAATGEGGHAIVPLIERGWEAARAWVMCHGNMRPKAGATSRGGSG